MSDATTTTASPEPRVRGAAVVELAGIKKSFGSKEVLHGVDLTVHAGEHVVIFGPSGSGKSTLLRTINLLEEPSEGSVRVLGVEYGPGFGDKKQKRGGPLQLRRQVGMVFQQFNLFPHLTALDNIVRPLRSAKGLGRDEAEMKAAKALQQVGLLNWAAHYPAQLSGGQAQRVAIARALAVEPRILVLDEPTSALDVSVRAEVMNLLLRLQEELGLSFVFISHDLGMVRHISDDIQVMYLGRVVEAGPYDRVLDSALHPYTRALAAAVPVPDPVLEAERRESEPESAPALLAEPESGCPYHPRCPLAEQVCLELDPPLLALAAGHLAACHVAARSAGVSPAARAG